MFIVWDITHLANMPMNMTLNFSQTLYIVEWPFSAYIFNKFVLNALKILYR